MRRRVIGVDVGSYRMGMAVLDEQPASPAGWEIRWTGALELPRFYEKLGADGIERRLAEQYDLIETHLMRWGQASLVGVELPYVRGKTGTSLIAAYGVCAAAAARHHGAGVVTLNIQSWKAMCGAGGNCSKARVDAWARQALGYRGMKDIEITDSLGVAYAAAKILEAGR